MTDEQKSETPQEETKSTVKAVGETSPEETQKPLVNLDTTGKSEIEQRIVARSQGKKVEPKRAEELVKKTETPKQEEKKAEEKVVKPEEKAKTETPSVITEEMVKDFPALKTLVGKPIAELTKVYANLAKEFNRSQNELSTLKKKPEAKETKTTQEGEKTLEQQIDELIEKTDLPDPIDDQKAYNKAFAKLQMKIADLKIKEANKPLTEQFDKQKAIEQIRQQHNTAVSLVKEGVGKDVDLDELMGKFNEAMQPVLAEHPDLYNGKPEFLASDIIRFHLTDKVKKQNDELTATKAELEAAKTGKQPTTKELKAKIEGAPDQSVKSSVVQKEKNLSPAQEMENKIYKRHTGQDAY
jgi:hypothetical protein